MYESFFGLRERPFDLLPNPRFLFLSGRQREALSTLRYALSGPRGLTLLLGDAGMGKTTMVQAALSEISGSDAECVVLSNPTLTHSEFYEFLSGAFQLAPEAAHSKTQFLFALRHRVESRHQRGQITAIVIDEAQSLPHELLEEVRLLSNIETPTTKLLSVVLAGQSELGDRLNDPRLRQLKQRITLRCELAAFDLSETASYIAGRLRIAGGAPVEIFTRNAVDAVYQGSGGVPRIVSVICENALIGGFATQTKPISRALIEEVLRDFDFNPPRSSDGRDATAANPPVSTDKVAVAGGAPPELEAPQEPRSVLTSFGRKRGFSFF